MCGDFNAHLSNYYLCTLYYHQAIGFTRHQVYPSVPCCVSASRFLSDGNSYKDCGHPCESKTLHLRDQGGADHLVLADMGCRNTVFNAKAQSGTLGNRSFGMYTVCNAQVCFPSSQRLGFGAVLMDSWCALLRVESVMVCSSPLLNAAAAHAWYLHEALCSTSQ